MTKNTARPDPADPEQIPNDERDLLVDDDHAEPSPYDDETPQEDGL